MDLTLSDEQRLLRDSVDRFIAEPMTPVTVAARGDPLGFSREIWNQFAGLGWLALPIPEAYGGLGAGAVETGILMEVFGRGLVTEPYLATVVIGGSLIAECGSEAQQQAMLPAIADGALLLAFAHSERAALDLAHVETTAQAKRRTAGASTAARSPCSTACRRPDHRLRPHCRRCRAAGELCLFLVPSGHRRTSR